MPMKIREGPRIAVLKIYGSKIKIQIFRLQADDSPDRLRPQQIHTIEVENVTFPHLGESRRPHGTAPERVIPQHSNVPDPKHGCSKHKCTEIQA